MTTTLLNQLMLQPNALKLYPLHYSYLNSRALQFVLSMATYNVSLGFLFTVVMLEQRLKMCAIFIQGQCLKFYLDPLKCQNGPGGGLVSKPPLWIYIHQDQSTLNVNLGWSCSAGLPGGRDSISQHSRDRRV